MAGVRGGWMRDGIRQFSRRVSLSSLEERAARPIAGCSYYGSFAGVR